MGHHKNYANRFIIYIIMQLRSLYTALGLFVGISSAIPTENRGLASSLLHPLLGRVEHSLLHPLVGRALTKDNTCGNVLAGNSKNLTCDPTLAQGGACCSGSGYCGQYSGILDELEISSDTAKQEQPPTTAELAVKQALAPVRVRKPYL